MFQKKTVINGVEALQVNENEIYNVSFRDHLINGFRRHRLLCRILGKTIYFKIKHMVRLG